MHTRPESRRSPPSLSHRIVSLPSSRHAACTGKDTWAPCSAGWSGGRELPGFPDPHPRPAHSATSPAPAAAAIDGRCDYKSARYTRRQTPRVFPDRMSLGLLFQICATFARGSGKREAAGRSIRHCRKESLPVLRVCSFLAPLRCVATPQDRKDSSGEDPLALLRGYHTRGTSSGRLHHQRLR